MAERPLQTSQDAHKLFTVRAEPWEAMLVQVFREADTGVRIRPARLFLGQMAVGHLARREPGWPSACSQIQVLPQEGEREGIRQ